LIGDCETAALVSRGGSLDWLCWPRFDSGACCAALLGKPANGRWLVAPQGAATIKRRYRTDTLILETEFTTETGAAALIDFMPVRGRDSHVVRLVVGLIGVSFALNAWFGPKSPQAKLPPGNGSVQSQRARCLVDQRASPVS